MAKYTIEHEGDQVEVDVSAGLPLSLARHFERQIEMLLADAPVECRIVVEAQRARDAAKEEAAVLRARVDQLERQIEAANYGKENAIYARTQAVEYLRYLREHDGAQKFWQDLDELLKEIDPSEDDLRERENREGGTTEALRVHIGDDDG